MGKQTVANVILPEVSKCVGVGLGDIKEFKTLYLLHGLLEELDIEHVYKESEGDHSWKWWDLHIQHGLSFIFK